MTRCAFLSSKSCVLDCRFIMDTPCIIHHKPALGYYPEYHRDMSPERTSYLAIQIPRDLCPEKRNLKKDFILKMIYHSNLSSLMKRKEKKMGKKAECPACFFEWQTDDDNIMEGEVITCPDCGQDLEVAGVKGNQLKLEKMDGSGEDWGE